MPDIGDNLTDHDASTTVEYEGPESAMCRTDVDAPDGVHEGTTV